MGPEQAAPGVDGRSSPPTIKIADQGRITTAEKHADEVKGRLKQAAGSLTDDKSLTNEGGADQAQGDSQGQGRTVKDKVDKVADALTARNKK